MDLSIFIYIFRRKRAPGYLLSVIFADNSMLGALSTQKKMKIFCRNVRGT